ARPGSVASPPPRSTASSPKPHNARRAERTALLTAPCPCSVLPSRWPAASVDVTFLPTPRRPRQGGTMWQSTPKSDRPGRIEIEDSTDRRIKAVAVDDDGLITVAGMENVALAFIGVPDVRERQADLIQQKLITIA